MKRLIPTLVLVILAAVGLWYAKSHDFFKDKPTEENKQILTAAISPDDVQAVKLKNEATTELSRSNQDWQIDKPFAMPVNQYLIDGWISAFSQLGFTTKVGDNVADLTTYELDKPQQTYEIVLKDGSSKKLLIGKLVSATGQYYGKLADAAAVFTIRTDTLSTVSKNALDFMDKSVFKFQYDDVKSLTVSHGTGKWTLDKTDAAKPARDAKWTLDGSDFATDDATGLLTQIMIMTTDRVIEQESKIPIDKPELTIELKQSKDGKETTDVYIGKADKDDKSTVWIKKQGGQWAYAVNAQKLQDLIDRKKQQ